MKRGHAITVMPVAKHLSRRWGVRVLDEFQLYQEAEERSKRRCGLL